MYNRLCWKNLFPNNAKLRQVFLGILYLAIFFDFNLKQAQANSLSESRIPKSKVEKLVEVLTLAQTITSKTKTLSEQLDIYVQAHLETAGFMGSVLVAQNNEIFLNKGYGMASLEHNILNTPQTKYRVGSITKQFTAVAILQLQERGLLRVDVPISTYIPNYIHGNQITIHQLLNHTSGIPNMSEFPDAKEIQLLPTNIEKTFARFKDKPLDFPPGDRYHYNNSGYILLTKIIESVSGQTYAQYIQENIFEPLGMSNSGYDDYRKVIINRASGYVLDSGEYQHSRFIDMSLPQGAGGIYSTVEDLYKWDRWLYTNELLSKSSLTAMFMPTIQMKPDEDPTLYYGYGWVITEYLGRKLIRHRGGINGFRATIDRYPDDNLVIIILSNVQDSPILKMRQDLAAIVLGESYSLP